jgi:hypothetical protein
VARKLYEPPCAAALLATTAALPRPNQPCAVASSKSLLTMTVGAAAAAAAWADDAIALAGRRTVASVMCHARDGLHISRHAFLRYLYGAV